MYTTAARSREKHTVSSQLLKQSRASASLSSQGGRNITTLLTSSSRDENVRACKGTHYALSRATYFSRPTPRISYTWYMRRECSWPFRPFMYSMMALLYNDPEYGSRCCARYTKKYRLPSNAFPFLPLRFGSRNVTHQKQFFLGHVRVR